MGRQCPGAPVVAVCICLHRKLTAAGGVQPQPQMLVQGLVTPPHIGVSQRSATGVCRPAPCAFCFCRFSFRNAIDRRPRIAVLLAAEGEHIRSALCQRNKALIAQAISVQACREREVHVDLDTVRHPAYHGDLHGTICSQRQAVPGQIAAFGAIHVHQNAVVFVGRKVLCGGLVGCAAAGKVPVTVVGGIGVIAHHNGHAHAPLHAVCQRAGHGDRVVIAAAQNGQLSVFQFGLGAVRHLPCDAQTAVCVGRGIADVQGQGIANACPAAGKRGRKVGGGDSAHDDLPVRVACPVAQGIVLAAQALALCRFGAVVHGVARRGGLVGIVCVQVQAGVAVAVADVSDAAVLTVAHGVARILYCHLAMQFLPAGQHHPGVLYLGLFHGHAHAVHIDGEAVVRLRLYCVGICHQRRHRHLVVDADLTALHGDGAVDDRPVCHAPQEGLRQLLADHLALPAVTVGGHVSACKALTGHCAAQQDHVLALGCGLLLCHVDAAGGVGDERAAGLVHEEQRRLGLAVLGHDVGLHILLQLEQILLVLSLVGSAVCAVGKALPAVVAVVVVLALHKHDSHALHGLVLRGDSSLGVVQIVQKGVLVQILVAIAGAALGEPLDGTPAQTGRVCDKLLSRVPVSAVHGGKVVHRRHDGGFKARVLAGVQAGGGGSLIPVRAAAHHVHTVQRRIGQCDLALGAGGKALAVDDDLRIVAASHVRIVHAAHAAGRVDRCCGRRTQITGVALVAFRALRAGVALISLNACGGRCNARLHVVQVGSRQGLAVHKILFFVAHLFLPKIIFPRIACPSTAKTVFVG